MMSRGDSMHSTCIGSGRRAGLKAVLGLAGALSLAPIETARAIGDAYVVDDYDVNAPGVCTLEASYAAARNGDLSYAATPGCGFKLGTLGVELDGEFQRGRVSGEWQTNAGTTIKTVLLPMANNVGIGLSTTAMWDTVTGAGTSVNINVPVTFQLTQDFRLHINGGWLYDRTQNARFVTWGISPEYALTPWVMLIAEVFQQYRPESLDPRTVTSPRVQAGVRFSPNKNLDIDIIYGRNINGENANWLTIGFIATY